MQTIESGISFKVNKTHEGVKFNNGIFPSHFLCLIIAKPGTGKTTLIKFLLSSNDIFFKRYDFIFIVSPSAIEEYSDVFLPSENYSSEFDFNWLSDKFNRINLNYKNEYINVLLVLDDVIANIYESRNSKQLMSLIFNRRHLINNGMVSVIVTSQKFNSIPTTLRSVVNVLILFEIWKRDISVIGDEIITSKYDFEQICSFAFDTPGNFLLCNLNDDRFFKNFDIINIYMCLFLC